MAHEPTYLVEVKSLLHYCRCTCGMESGGQLSKQRAEDWWLQHETMVQRVRAHLKQSTPSLKGTRDYYRRMADDPHQPMKNRDIFRSLAAELTQRLGEGDGPKWEQDELPLGLDPR